MKNIIIYCSIHHNNTFKLLQSGCDNLDVELVNIKNAKDIELSKYNVVGFASGIYNGKFHQSLFDFIDNSVSLPKKAFLVHTSGSGNKKYALSFINLLKEKDIDIIDSFCCKGLDTFGVFKYIGGISRKHPDSKDIDNFRNFISTII